MSTKKQIKPANGVEPIAFVMDGSVAIHAKLPSKIETLHLAVTTTDGITSYKQFDFTEDAGIHILHIVAETPTVSTEPIDEPIAETEGE